MFANFQIFANVTLLKARRAALLFRSLFSIRLFCFLRTPVFYGFLLTRYRLFTWFSKGPNQSED